MENQYPATLEDNRVGRIRLATINDASSSSLHGFLQDCVEKGSTVRTDGWNGYNGLESLGYVHEVIKIKGQEMDASELLPNVHLVVSLLKRWILGTHQGSVSRKHYEYYLDEFTFRFNRRTSASRGKLFYRLLENAVCIKPTTYGDLTERIEN
jgi:transposase-like protein